MKKKKNSLSISQSTKKNLRRNIETCFEDQLKFTNVRGALFVHPSVMSFEQVIILFCEPEKDGYVAKAAAAIRKEAKCLKDEMAWRPQPSDLEAEKFKIQSKLNEFLIYLLTENEISSRGA